MPIVTAAQPFVGFGPHFSFPTIVKGLNWQDFYYDLKDRKPEAFDKVIRSLERLTEPTSEEWLDEEMRDEHDINVTELKIAIKLDQYFRELTYGQKISIEDKAKLTWNWGNNILRCLKRIRNDEAPFQLPYEDKELTFGFIERMAVPPINPLYR